MVKTPPKQPTELAKPTTAVAKSTSAQHSAWPTQQKVAHLARWLDLDYSHYQAMQKLSEKLNAATTEWSRNQTIEQAKQAIEYFEVLGGLNSIKNGHLRKLWDACFPESWWPEDRDGPVPGKVAKMIALLMGSFPTSNIPEPEIFVPVLLDDVMALKPSFVEMESTCRQLRQTKKFMPAISEVVETLREQQKLWARRDETFYCIEETYNDLRDQIARAKAADDRKAAKSQPIVVGDRVRDPKLGSGTVTALVPLDGGGTHYRVRFDASTERYVAGAAYLERLVAGDENFEPPAISMIEQRNDVPMAPIASPVALDANGDKVDVPADRSRQTRNGEDD
jgi:hypothetical protein